MARYLLIIGAIFLLTGFSTLQDGSLVLTPQEVIGLQRDLAEIEAQTELLIRQLNETKKELAAERSRRCVLNERG